ncbi:MAG TPA: Ni/Fe hydrogenase subunit alpha [Thermoplasmata archaeon]|nr:Ni/Fe hydrogenase subunit alpha [Thermoplasmata archaeon]
MSANLNIALHHVTRVEGHGNIYVNVKDGNVERIEWNISEAPRFFEAMVVGRTWKELHHITSRICGICSIGHTVASLKATERAMGIEISEQDQILRRLAVHAENLQSHVLHVGYLALPDFLGVGSVIPLVETHPEEVKTVIRLHRLANEMSDLICGRTTHPQRLIPGGFSKIPTVEELYGLKGRLGESVPDLKAVAGLLEALKDKIPDFTRETEFIGLTNDEEYALYDGDVASTLAGRIDDQDYLEFVHEFVVPYSTAKHARNKMDSYMVGALARLNLNYDKLSPLAKQVAGMFDLKPICHNPFMNNIAQLVEVVHSVEDSIALIERIERRGLEPIPDYNSPEIEVRAGHGVGAVEVPRGILFHEYWYDEKGVCTKANCVIPTNQNHRNIQLDLEKLVPAVMDRPQPEVELLCEMLVRAYDPCISCSCHYTKVHWV